jgi:hypothetical protein
VSSFQVLLLSPVTPSRLAFSTWALLPGTYNLTDELIFTQNISLIKADPLSSVIFDGSTLLVNNAMIGIHCPSAQDAQMNFSGITFQNARRAQKVESGLCV